MRRLFGVFATLVSTLLACGTLHGQTITSKYHTYDEMTAAVKSLASSHRDILSVESIGKTRKGRDVWALSLRKGKADEPRALLVVGGLEGAHIAGSEMALRFAEQLAGSFGKVDSITRLLESTTVYVIPRLNPDAIESFFEKPLRERTTNLQPSDDDRDGAIDEDDVEDVNKDGMVSFMRVKDPRGEWMVHPEDSRVMKKADAAKGEKGIYLLYSEGVDNDKDEQWNEDAVGGVDLNRNFPFNYQHFSPNAGVYQVSEPESRGIAEFIFAHPNIGAVFSFSVNDNLTTPWKAEPRRPAATDAAESLPSGMPFGRRMDDGTRGPVTSVLEEDQPYYEFISKQFLDITKLSNAPETKKGAGAFSEWVYYHAGRWSFSVRPWWPPVATSRRDTGSADAARRPRGQTTRPTQDASPDEYSEQLRALKWYDAGGFKDIAIPWKAVKHVDFPDREVEIGGIRPFALSNPPADSINALSQPYSKFLVALATQLPSLSLGNTKVEKVNDNVYRVSVDVCNNGYFPTNSGLGMRVRWPRNVNLTLELAKDQSLASGRAKQQLRAIKGSGGYQSMTWLVVGRAGSSVKVIAESPIAGRATETIILREGGQK
jgi:hypothetical protein